MEELKREFLGRYADRFDAVPCTPVAATFCSALARLSEIGLASHLDEETVTAALLGALAGVFPFCVALFSEDDKEASRCSWGQYNKSKTAKGTDSEAVRGADFVLVVWTSKTAARVAIFQAKRADLTQLRRTLTKLSKSETFVPADRQSDTPWVPSTLSGAVDYAAFRTAFPHPRPVSVEPSGQFAIDVHRRREPDEAGKIPASQIELLTRAGESILAARHAGSNLSGSAAHAAPPAPGNAAMDLSPDAIRTRLAPLSFIHYLGYLHADGQPLITGTPPPADDTVDIANGIQQQVLEKLDARRRAPDALAEPVCIPLEGMDHALWRDGTNRNNAQFSSNPVDLALVPTYSFADILLSALAPTDVDVFGWITLDKETLDSELPGLQEFGMVVMADRHGGVAGLTNKPGSKFVNVQLKLDVLKRRGWTP
ncbi:hypothetical protein ABIE56_000347 [Luteibacter sp. 621]|uniref:hypothetical protein n=1 Tax=Luteibacter sp. 621 TaxID=3373916 RepID=UPI003D2623B2